MVHRMHRFFLLPLILAASRSILALGQEPPSQTPVTPERIGKLEKTAGSENSGLVQSARTPGLYWGLNDSGNPPRIYPLTEKGTLWSSHANRRRPGVFVGEAMNVDWEDMAVDPESQSLIIADVGNNWSSRESLTLYWVKEPDPNATLVIPTLKRSVYFPDQTAYPAPNNDRNFDCEAVFFAFGKVHLLTKHRSDRATKLYRLDEPDTPSAREPLTLVQRFDIGEQVTGAAFHSGSSTLGLITYDSLWEFDCAPNQPRLLNNPKRWSPYRGPRQVEAIATDVSGGWLITDELSGRLFRMPPN